MRRHRQRAIDRLECERDAEAERKRKTFWHNVIIVKATVMTTFFLYLLVPPEHKDWVALGGNLLWLWRT